MNKQLLESVSLFSPFQLGILITVCVLFVAAVALNVVLFRIFRRRGERKLCTRQLQQKRNELLERLDYIRSGGVIESTHSAEALAEAADADDEDEEDEDEEGDDTDTDDDNTAAVQTVETEPDPESAPDAEILAVREMSQTTRERLGFIGKEYDLKQYYVRYILGFEAKLRDADEQVKERYRDLADEIALYKGVNIKASFRQQRIYKGKKTLGLIHFRGKTLCIALALNPADYAETKYRGIDKSDKKRFAKTPMLLRLSSDRKLEYAKYLLVQIADANTIVMNESPVAGTYDLDEKTRDEMFVAEKLKIQILGEAPDLESAPDEEEEEIAEVVEETFIVGSKGQSEKVTRRVIYNRSFTARVIQANDELKARYSELKNYILSYGGVKASVSWKRETFRFNKKTVAVFSIIGKTLCLYLAVDPARFADTKYAVEDMSSRRSCAATPTMYRVKGDRRTAYSKQLIDLVLTEAEAVKTDRRPEDYTTPYKSTATLVKRGLIRETPESEKKIPPKKKKAAEQPAAATEQPSVLDGQPAAAEALPENETDKAE